MGKCQNFQIPISHLEGGLDKGRCDMKVKLYYKREAMGREC